MKSFSKIISGLTKMTDELRAHNVAHRERIKSNSIERSRLEVDSTLRVIEIDKAENAIKNISALTK